MSKEILFEYAMSFAGLPYIYGGDDPVTGLDCSGLVIEILQSQGILPLSYDATARGLYVNLSKRFDDGVLGLGTVLFYGPNVESISHVAFALSPFLMLEAGGGDPTVTTREIAAKKNAFVRVRPIRANNLAEAVKPKYPWE